jgi:hypothetical protein
VRKVALAITPTLILLSAFGGVTTLAQDETLPHEDPETAAIVYDGIAILDYLSSMIDGVLARQPALVASLGEKRPFANIPAAMETPLERFAEASAGISPSIIEIEDALDVIDSLARQFRLEEVNAQRQPTLEKLALTREWLLVMEESATTAETELNVPPSDRGGPLRAAYLRLLDRIARLRDLLGLYEELLEALPESSLEELLEALPESSLEELLEALPESSLEELLEALPESSLQELLEALPESSLEELLEALPESSLQELLEALPEGPLEELLEAILRTTEISLTAEPTEAFVGEQIEFRGDLVAEGAPLPGREVVVLFDGVPRLRTTTGSDGSYRRSPLEAPRC